LSSAAKQTIEPFPEAGCLAVYVIHKDSGPVGHKHGNPAIGWGIRIGPDRLPGIFKHVREAKKYAEENYAIKGWMKPGRAPYHQHYAIPADPKRKPRKYRSIDAHSNYNLD